MFALIKINRIHFLENANLIDYVPFEINPSQGLLVPGESVTYTVKFMPLKVFVYKAELRCKIENLPLGKMKHVIEISAESLSSYCVFEVERSDYTFDDSEISNNCLKDTRVFEFEIMGVGQFYTRYRLRFSNFKFIGLKSSNFRSFNIFNPTTSNYSFEWDQLKNNSLIHFLQKCGRIEAGKKTKIVCKIKPDKVGISENFWRFEVKKFDLKLLIVIVLRVTEPRVFFDRPCVKLKPCIKGNI